MIRGRLAALRLEGLLALAGLEGTGHRDASSDEATASVAAAWLERAGHGVPRAARELASEERRSSGSYESALDHFAGERLVATLPHGESVRLTAANRQVAWNPEEYEAFRQV